MNGSIFFYALNGEGALDWVGSTMLWVLLLLSVVNISLIVQSMMGNQRRTVFSASACDALRELLASGRYNDAIQRATRGTSDLELMVARALDRSPQGVEAMSHAAEERADELLAVRLRALERLNILGQVAPMLGLFGTVYGMIAAFQTIASTGGAANPVMLAGGIGAALVSTFWGLFIAIPATGAYAAMRNNAIAHSDEALAATEELIALFRPAHDAAANK